MLKKRVKNVIFSLLVIGLGILGFIIHEQKDDLRVIHTIAAVTKEWIWQIFFLLKAEWETNKLLPLLNHGFESFYGMIDFLSCRFYMHKQAAVT